MQIPDESKINMRKLEPPTQIKFEQKGHRVSGVLTHIEKMRLQTGQVVAKYTLQPLGKEKVTFIGTTYVDQILGPEHIGFFVKVEYIGDSTDVVRNGRPMKIFDIFVSDGPVVPGLGTGQKTDDGTYITDADIPF